MSSINSQQSRRSKTSESDIEPPTIDMADCSSNTDPASPRDCPGRTTANTNTSSSHESEVMSSARRHKRSNIRDITNLGRMLKATSLTEHVEHKHKKEHTTMSTAPTASLREDQGERGQAMNIRITPQPYIFPHWTLESGFCFALCMTQFLAEYLISGFALQLPILAGKQHGVDSGTGALWPAALLSLIMSAALLVFARISDMFGGYWTFLFGTVWLTIWTLVPGVTSSISALEIARAMQGLALAAFMPSTFAILGRLYAPGPRKTLIVGIYSGFAPLGFFFGFLVAGALPKDHSNWYFLTGALISSATSVVAFVTIPRRQTDIRNRELHMDWSGTLFIVTGLVLVCYGLTVAPHDGYVSGTFLGTFISGFVCLFAAVGIEMWVATCPLVPLSFFKPRSVRAFSLACMCFYSSFGIWLYYSADYLQNYTITNVAIESHPVLLALWYLPMALLGLACCFFIPVLLQAIPAKPLLLATGILWIVAPILLIVAPHPLPYWSFAFPSILCATAGINLTFTISLVFLCALQPPKLQGLCGAICSMFLGLAFAFGLPIAQIVMERVSGTNWIMKGALGEGASGQELDSMVSGFRASFIYAAASAGLGLVICVFLVRMPRLVEAKQVVSDGHELSEGGLESRGTGSSGEVC